MPSRPPADDRRDRGRGTADAESDALRRRSAPPPARRCRRFGGADAPWRAAAPRASSSSSGTSREQRRARGRERGAAVRRRRVSRASRGARLVGVQTEVVRGRVELAVELRGEELVELVGFEGGGWRPSSHGLGVGCSEGVSRFPRRSASAARPREIRERTVPGRDAEHLGDLGVVHADEVAERDRGAVLGAQVARARRRRRGGRRTRPRCPTASIRPLVSGRCSVGHRPPAAAAGLVERGVGRDAVRPRRELGPAVERTDLARDREQRLLGRVERVVGIGEDSPAHAVDERGVAAQGARRAPRCRRRRPACASVVIVIVVRAPTRVSPAGRSRRYR